MSNQLIPISYLKEACFISDNIDERKLRPHIEEAQEYLRDLLGNEFYDQIETQYNAQTLSSDNTTLYENYIRKFLAWQTYLLFLGFSNSDSTPSGERAFSDDNSTILEDVKMFSKEKNIRKYAENWRNRMINFISEAQSNDSTKYPLYTEKCRQVFSFGITCVDKDSDTMITINKSIITND